MLETLYIPVVVLLSVLTVVVVATPFILVAAVRNEIRQAKMLGPNFYDSLTHVMIRQNNLKNFLKNR